MFPNYQTVTSLLLFYTNVWLQYPVYLFKFPQCYDLLWLCAVKLQNDLILLLFYYTPVCLQHPVYCVNVVGTQNAHNLISVSTDGKMCSWSLDMLSQPQVGRTQSSCQGLLKSKNMLFNNAHIYLIFCWVVLT